MKNLIWILAAIMLAGCGDNEEGQDMGLHGDPPGYSLFIWSNESDHRITMTVTDRFEKKEILPGESLLQEEVGFVTPPSLEGYMIDGVSIVFDDGPYFSGQIRLRRLIPVLNVIIRWNGRISMVILDFAGGPIPSPTPTTMRPWLAGR